MVHSPPSMFKKPGSIIPTLPFQALPLSAIEDTIDVTSVATSFEERLAKLHPDDLAQEVIWRDLFALTGTSRTFYGPSKVHAIWNRLGADRAITSMKFDPGTARVVRVGESSAWIEARYSFRMTGTPKATGKLIVSLLSDTNERWKAWMLRTILDQLESHSSVDHLESVDHKTKPNGLTNGTTREQDSFDCVVVGGGQFGLSVGGRLQALNLSYVVLETNEKVGDSWKLRYDSVKLHTTRESSYLPFDKTFPSTEYHKYLTKDEMAEGYCKWVDKYGIKIWLNTSLVSGEWQADPMEWKLQIVRDQHERTITAKHVVMATGAGGRIPRWPKYPGIENFRGTIMHSHEYKSSVAWKGKAGVVIGFGNSGPDVAEDMVAAGCSSVTVVQRSPTFVFKRGYHQKGQDMIYNDKSPIEVTDMGSLSNPLAVQRLLANHGLHSMIKGDADHYDVLERTGFKLIRYGDIMHQLYEHWGAYHMDVGAVDKILNGSIRIKSDALPTAYSEKGLVFADGVELPADVIIFATGFEGNTKDLVRELFGSMVADQIEDFWGLDPEGELWGNARPCGHPGLWMMGGSCSQARYLSRFVALSIRADLDGNPLKVHRRQDD